MEQQRIDSFNQLLNKIIHELDEQRLQSLITIYKVPGSSLARMKDGHAFFRYLMDQDFIKKDKVGLGNLRKLLKKMLPEKRRLVVLVENYINKELEKEDASSILNDFSETWEHLQVENPALLNSYSSHATPKALFNCTCHRLPIPSCFFALIIFTILAVFAACTIHFCCEEVPKFKVMIIVLCFFLLFLVVLCLYQKCRKRGYDKLVNVTVQKQSAAQLNTTVPCSSTKLVDAKEKERAVSAIRTYRNSTSHGSPDSAVFNDQSGLGSVSPVGVMEPQDV